MTASLTTPLGFHLRRLDPGAIPALQNLLEQCADYFLLVSGADPGSDAAQALFSQLPPGKAPLDKFVFGVFSASDELVGVLDAVRRYPAPGARRLANQR